MPTKVCTRCNAEKEVTEFYLQDGYARSHCKGCHVSQTSARIVHTIAGRANRLIVDARKRAKAKGLPMTITTTWVKQQIEGGRCAVTGLEFDLSGAGTGDNPRSFTPSIDRKDPSLGYTHENSQVVCWIYNRAKGVQGHEDVIRMARSLCQQ